MLPYHNNYGMINNHESIIYYIIETIILGGIIMSSYFETLSMKELAMLHVNLHDKTIDGMSSLPVSVIAQHLLNFKTHNNLSSDNIKDETLIVELIRIKMLFELKDEILKRLLNDKTDYGLLDTILSKEGE